MRVRLGELKIKEVIGVNNGSRFGYVGDVELDPDSGRVLGLIIPGRLRLLGLLGREKPVVIPWQAVRRFGEDTVLVDLEKNGGEVGGKEAEMMIRQEK